MVEEEVKEELKEEIVDEREILDVVPIEPAEDVFNDESIPSNIRSTYELFWSGFITRSGKNNFGVDGYYIGGDYNLAVEEVFNLKYHNLNVCHRTTLEELLGR